MKLFVVIKEKGELCNFYSGLIACNITKGDGSEIKIDGALQYSQYDRISRYKNIKDPEKFKTVKDYIHKRFGPEGPIYWFKEDAINTFIKRLLNLTGSSQLWVHEKSL